MKANKWALILVFLVFSSQAQDRPRQLLAVEVAYAHFQKELSKESYPDVEYSALIANIENYSVGISFNKQDYFVVFIPRLPGYDIEGGGAKYVIRKKDMVIIDFVKNK